MYKSLFTNELDTYLLKQHQLKSKTEFRLITLGSAAGRGHKCILKNACFILLTL